MGKLWKQLTCLHLWVKGLPVDLQYGKGYLWRYDCKECDKIIYRWYGNEPISGIITDEWYDYMQNPEMKVSPPIIKRDPLD